MPPDRNLAFRDECLANIPPTFARLNMVLIRVSLREEESPDNKDDGWTGAEPKQRSPTMRCGIDESTGERSCKEVSKCVALLEYTAHQTSGLRRDILKRRGCCVTVKAPHGYTEEGTTGEELTVGVAETSTLGFAIRSVTSHMNRIHPQPDHHTWSRRGYLCEWCNSNTKHTKHTKLCQHCSQAKAKAKLWGKVKPSLARDGTSAR